MELPNLFGIGDDILVEGYEHDGRDRDNKLSIRNFQKENLKLGKDKCHFICTSDPFFGEIISRQVMRTGPKKLKALRYATMKIKVGTAGIRWHYKLLKHSFPNDS